MRHHPRVTVMRAAQHGKDRDVSGVFRLEHEASERQPMDLLKRNLIELDGGKLLALDAA